MKKYPFRRLRDKEIKPLIEEAMMRKKELGSKELHSGDVKIQLRDDGEIQVWRLDSYGYQT